MAKKKDNSRPKAKRPRITTKFVQATENLPLPLPAVDHKPEIEEEPWDAEGMTLKQRRFCEAYVGEAGGNATKAAKIAGYSDNNYFVLGSTAAENLKKPQIRSYIGRLLAASGATPDFLKNRLAQIAQSSLDNVLTMNAEGEVEIDLEQAARLGALGQIKEFKEETLEIATNVVKRKRTVKMHDPHPAIRTLLEMYGKITAPEKQVVEVVFRRSLPLTDHAERCSN